MNVEPGLLASTLEACKTAERALTHGLKEGGLAGLDSAWQCKQALEYVSDLLAQLQFPPAVEILYTNWRGVTAWRKVHPIKTWYGSNSWHPTHQWFLGVYDPSKGPYDPEYPVNRDLAYRSIKQWGRVEEGDR